MEPRAQHRRWARVLVPCALAATIAVVASLQGASPGTAAPAKPRCKFAGLRYTGTTTQKRQVCFTLTKDGRGLREYAFDYRDSCGTGSVRAYSAKRGTIAAVNSSGKFASTSSGSFFKGTIRGSSAGGTLKQHSQQVMPGTTPQTLVCDTGVVRWTAYRAG